MCGIIGFTGNNPAQNILIDGLEKLEYRGYDSAGIALQEVNGNIEIRKKAGKVAFLREYCENHSSASTCGIGHTRWATHGGVTDGNAHPHQVGAVTIIHNGIIENYHEIVNEYHLADKLSSETDSEVVAALLNSLYNGDPKATIKKALDILKGAFALCIMFNDIPDVIYAVRNVSPMVVAHCDKGSFIASDLTALIEYTKFYFILPEYNILTMEKDKVTIEDLQGNIIEPEMLEVTWDVESAQKGGYPYFMLKEIYEQPDAITKTIAPRIKDGLPDFTEDSIPDSVFEGIEKINVIACGTALHAGMVFKTMVESQVKIPVTASIASEFRYEDPIIDEKTLVIVISQSGETIDTLEALKLAKSLGSKTISVVNVKGSTIARESDYVLYTHAGPEIAVASTKAYTVQLAALYLLGCKLALITSKYTDTKAKDFINDLQKSTEAVKAVLDMSDTIKEATKKLIHAEDAFFLGRGLDYTLSLEGALKLKEISYIHAEAYAAGELKHGTIALITDNVPVIAYATQARVYSKVISNIREVKARNAYVILISKDAEITDTSICDIHIKLPHQPDLFTVFASAAVLQLIAYYTTEAKGLDVDKPRNLAKSVTVE